MLFDGNGKVHGKRVQCALYGEAALMKNKRIKTDWASLSVTDGGSIIVGAKCNGDACNIRFDSLVHLKGAISSKKILVKRWAIAIPRSSCILRAITLPASDMAEAAKMIEFELPALVPLSAERIVYGCTLLSKQENMLRVLVNIVKLSMLINYLQPLKAIGVEPARIILSSLAVQNWFDITSEETAGPKISVFANKYRCDILTSVNGNFQKVSELISDGGNAATFAHEIVQEILHRRQDACLSSKKENTVLLAGAEEYVLEIKNILLENSDNQSSLKVSVVAKPEIISFEGDKYEIDGCDLYYEAIMAEGLLELVTNSKLSYSDLLPKQYVRKSKQRALLFNCVLTGTEAVLLILLVWLSLAGANWRIKRLCRRIESQIAPIESAAGSVESKRQRVKAIQIQLSKRGQITQIIEELYRYTPESISISDFKFVSKDSKTSIEIKGQADALADAFEYTNAMSNAKLLNGIQIIDAQQVPRLGGSVVEFKANCIIGKD